MRAHKALSGLDSEVKPVRRNDLVSDEPPKRTRVCASSFLTQGLLYVIIVIWLLQNSCSANGEPRATSSEFPDTAVSANGWPISKGQCTDLMRDRALVPLSVVANSECHVVPQAPCTGHNAANCCHLASSATHMVCGSCNVQSHLTNSSHVGTKVCWISQSSPALVAVQGATAGSSNRARDNGSNCESLTVRGFNAKSNLSQARDLLVSHLPARCDQPISHGQAEPATRASRDDLCTDECWVPSADNSSHPRGWGTKGNTPHWGAHEVCALSAIECMREMRLGLINLSYKPLTFSIDDLRTKSPRLVRLQHAPPPKPKGPEQERRLATREVHGDHFHQQLPPLEPLPYQLDPAEEAAREQRHIAACIKARPGTTEAYWRGLHTEIPNENLARRRPSDALYRMESLRPSDNFVAAPTASAAAPSQDVQHPFEAPPGRKEREHYQLHQSASDEERPSTKRADMPSQTSSSAKNQREDGQQQSHSLRAATTPLLPNEHITVRQPRGVQQRWMDRAESTHNASQLDSTVGTANPKDESSTIRPNQRSIHTAPLANGSEAPRAPQNNQRDAARMDDSEVDHLIGYTPQHRPWQHDRPWDLQDGPRELLRTAGPLKTAAAIAVDDEPWTQDKVREHKRRVRQEMRQTRQARIALRDTQDLVTEQERSELRTALHADEYFRQKLRRQEARSRHARNAAAIRSQMEAGRDVPYEPTYGSHAGNNPGPSHLQAEGAPRPLDSASRSAFRPHEHTDTQNLDQSQQRGSANTSNPHNNREALQRARKRLIRQDRAYDEAMHDAEAFADQHAQELLQATQDAERSRQSKSPQPRMHHMNYQWSHPADDDGYYHPRAHAQRIDETDNRHSGPRVDLFVAFEHIASRSKKPWSQV